MSSNSKEAIPSVADDPPFETIVHANEMEYLVDVFGPSIVCRSIVNANQKFQVVPGYGAVALKKDATPEIL